MSESVAVPSFSIVEIPGKSKGVVAVRDISRGELVLAEAPIFIQPASRTNQSIAKALKALSKEEQKAFLSLSNCKPTGSGVGVFKGIFDTNCLPLGEEPKAGIFVTGSRFNHCCTPNVHRWWHDDSGNLLFHAILDIKVGEELCIAYFQVENSPSEKRQARFRRSFGCACVCDTCSLPAMELKKSDERREAKARLDDVIASNYRKNPRMVMLTMLRVLIGLKEDRAVEGISDVYYLAFQVCVAAQDARSAKLWIERSHASHTMMRGSEYHGHEKNLSLLEDPRRHSAWGVGPKQDLWALTQSWTE